MNAERFRQVEELYHSAREREPSERSAFLAEACQGDEELRRKVELLLAQDASNDDASRGKILDRPAWEADLGQPGNARLTPGTQVGPYKIEAELGAGGMGEVYRAVDTRLKRTVAIKVAKENFGERFEREARAIAALNHPNICTLYDVGPNYLVMEFVEGESPRGPLRLEQALAIARQIADALEAAHEKNIVHRDLKPGNVKIKPDGIVKVLDFGLATQSVAREGEETTETMTAPGTILGTAAYMSPEQAQGKPVDKRADIWAFGVVLYEMLTGRRMFQGETVSDTLAAVLTKEPEWERVPAQVRRLLRSCLEKDSKRRLRDIGDVWRLFEDTPRPENLRRSWVAWGMAGVMTLALAAALVALWPRLINHPLVRLDVDLGPEVSLGSQGTDVILSPDGTRLVYVSQNRLFTRRLDQPKATELPGTEGAYAPFFSPDGQWLAFFAPGTLKKISVEGGSTTTICDAPAGEGGSWGEDGNIFAALTGNGGLSRVPSSGGAPAPLKELAQGGGVHRWPQILPGGKAVLFTANRTVTVFDGASIEVMSLADRRTKTLVRGGTFGRYLAPSRGTGQLVYVSRGTLFAVPFDPESLEVRGTPAPVLEQVAYSSANGSAQFEFSGAGSGPSTLVYRRGTGGGGMVTIQWLDGGGKAHPLLAKPGSYLRPRLSPDGQRLAMDIAEGSDSDFWVYDWQRDTMTRVTFGGNGFAQPVWSPDGRYIVGKNNEGMFWIRADGAGNPGSLTQRKDAQWPSSFSPDGKRLAYYEAGVANAYVLWTLPVESDGSGLRAGKPEPFLPTPFDERQPAFSPDGRWLAYASNESGNYQVYVPAFPAAPSGPGGKTQASNGGGTFPEWSRNGRELYFRTLDNRIMVANYTVKGDSFVVDKPRLWSEKQLADFGPVVPNYDLVPDGKRIVALMPADAPEDQRPQNHVIFLMNFLDELRRRVP
jgi:Tol biopolymer transport system component/predicted Ser/Thr protein kinase